MFVEVSDFEIVVYGMKSKPNFLKLLLSHQLHTKYVSVRNCQMWLLIRIHISSFWLQHVMDRVFRTELGVKREYGSGKLNSRQSLRSIRGSKHPCAVIPTPLLNSATLQLQTSSSVSRHLVTGRHQCNVTPPWKGSEASSGRVKRLHTITGSQN